MQHVNKIIGGLALVLFMIVLFLTLVMQLGDDGAVLISNDSDTLAIVGMVMVNITIVAGGVIMSGKIGQGYIDLVDRLTSDTQLQNAIELEYVAMPPGFQKSAVLTVAEIMSALVKLTPTDRDDKLAGWLQDALDGKIESLEPSDDPVTIS